MSASPVNPGDILVGRYRVDRVLGMGNMGIVVAATHLHLGTRVALKFMLATRNTSPQHAERFLREARAAAALKTEHIARVSEFGHMDNGAPFMVMEYLEGEDLAAVLQKRGPLPIAEAVDYILQACEAVGEAHSIGIIHRDLKPANLFLTGMGKRPCVKVLDFGISKLAEEEHALTKTGDAMGSPLYMSKEQMNSSKDVDGRTDIWSLAVTLYELIAGTGNTPFAADTLPKLCTRVCLDAPTPIARFRPDAPNALQGVLFQAVEKDRERRFPNVAEFAAALAPFGSPRAAMYVDRVASTLGEAIAPARPTDLLPPDPASGVPSAPVVGAAPVVGSGPMVPVASAVSMAAAATTGSALVRPAAPSTSRQRAARVAAAVVLSLGVLAVAALAVARWRATPPSAAVQGSAAVATVTPAVVTATIPTASASPEIPAVTPAPAPTPSATHLAATGVPSATPRVSHRPPTVPAAPRVAPAARRSIYDE